ncbi:MAG: AAA family ATPase, partial [Bacteroidia bacterium]|nr:AAA family ATPase [Bacteroidia bacterium]
MDHMIKWLEIENFKSIKKTKINCKRINVFVGAPNVGKSNILEAVSLLAGYNSINPQKFLHEYVRYEKVRNLFYDNDRKLNIHVGSNLGSFYCQYHMNAIDNYDLIFGPDKGINDFKSISQGGSLSHHINAFWQFVKEQYQEEKPEAFLKPFYCYMNDQGQVWEINKKENRYWGVIKKYEFKRGMQLNDKFS